MSAVLGELGEQSRAATEQSRAAAGQSRAAAEQSRVAAEQTRAQTRAIFALIDRLQGGGAAPAT